MRKIVWQITCITIVNTLLFNQVHSQGTITTSDLAKRYNPILTAVPFILIAPDSRAGTRRLCQPLGQGRPSHSLPSRTL